MKPLELTAAAIPVLAATEGTGANDTAAFELLMRQHERLVLATALRFTGNLEDAKDVSQEVFLKLYRNIGKVEARNIAGWLYRVTVNECHNLRRRSPASEPLESAPEAGAEDPALDPVERERRLALDMSLRRLSERERAALTMRDLEGQSTAEVARTLGVTEATVRSQSSKARIKMKAFVERYFRRVR
jgi:RNA polymerase sigma-70 factor (ECF subfamily)